MDSPIFSDLPIFSFTYFVICGIVSIVLWIQMLAILQEKGVKINPSFVTRGQLVAFWKVIRNEENEANKKKYKLIFWSQILLIPICFIGTIVLLPFG